MEDSRRAAQNQRRHQAYADMDPSKKHMLLQRRRLMINTTNITSPTQDGCSSSANSQRFNVTGTLQIPDVYQPIAYICENCNRMLCAEMNKEVRCRNCNEMKKAIPSYKLSVHIQTADGSKEATMPTQEVKNLLETINQKFANKTINTISIATHDSLSPAKTISIATQENLDPVTPMKKPAATVTATNTTDKDDKKRKNPDGNLNSTMPTTSKG